MKRSSVDTHTATFSLQYIDDKPGNFIDCDTGQILGSHKGIHYWTVGQGCRIPGSPKQYFVLEKNLTDNSITVAAGTDHPALFTDIVHTEAPYWIAGNPLRVSGSVRCSFRFQHTKKLVDCVVVSDGEDRLLVKLDTALRALTAGQYAVFYKHGECLGSSRITRPGPSLQFSQCNRSVCDVS